MGCYIENQTSEGRMETHPQKSCSVRPDRSCLCMIRSVRKKQSHTTIINNNQTMTPPHPPKPSEEVFENLSLNGQRQRRRWEMWKSIPHTFTSKPRTRPKGILHHRPDWVAALLERRVSAQTSQRYFEKYHCGGSIEKSCCSKLHGAPSIIPWLVS